jgi:hypothetical protein
MKMNRARILMTMISLGAVFTGELGYGAEAPERSNARSHAGESGKKAGDAGKKAGDADERETGMPPKAMARKRGVHPGQPQHKPPGKVALSHPEVKRKRDDHPPTAAGPGSGVALAQKPKAAPLAAKPAVEIPKTEGRPKEPASLAGSAAVNGTLMTAARHGAVNLASIGGITPSTARGAAAVNGTQLKRKP